MSIGTELLKEHKYEELWARYWGYIGLTMEEFMAMQRHLLLEQLEPLRACQLGQDIMAGTTPMTVDEFRALVPLKTYENHAAYLNVWCEMTYSTNPAGRQRPRAVAQGRC